jgi:carboxypeptidase Taq
MSFAKLDDLCRKLEALEHAQAMLGVDEAVMMPAGGGAKRAEAMAALAAMSHQQMTAPHIAGWIADAEAESLDQTQQAAVREFRRVYVNATCLSSDFVRHQVETRIRSEQLWRELRPSGDWQGFLPAFEGVVKNVREEAQQRAEVLKLAPYDALIEQYDPGSRVAEIAPVFADLKVFLKGFIPRAVAASEERLARHGGNFSGPFPIERQKALGLAMMKAVGFDFDHGRLDVSHHPFCGGVPSDVRMTTRYRTDEFLSALMGILHETGHGLYEQGLPTELAHWPSAKARGMGFHESQSLFNEKQIARNPDFWLWAMPLLAEHFGTDVAKGWTIEAVLAQVHRVEPGLIRVDADEATYPLHVILRFELEQDLVARKLAPRDVPEAWNAKMTDYLGLSTIDTPKDGPMQDVHWPSGAFGYFPSYTLGALMAAQQWAAVARALPSLSENVRAGDFAAINDWRRRNIWSKGSQLAGPDLLVEATGAPLDASHFKTHLERRYLN